MLFCIDEVVVGFEDIPLATESAELGSWAECKGLYSEPVGLCSASLNTSPYSGEVNQLGSPKCTEKARRA